MTPATREIYWNIKITPNSQIMYLLFGLALIIAAIGIWRRIALIKTGKATPSYSLSLLKRLNLLVLWGLFQYGVLKKGGLAFTHLLIYLGCLILFFTTCVIFVHHDLGYEIYQGYFYFLLSFLCDLFGLGLLGACLYALYRRYIVKNDLVHTRFADSFILWTLVLLCAQGFLLEALRIHATHDTWAIFSPVGLGLSKLLRFLAPATTTTLHYVIWWFHTLSVFFLIACFPYTKFFHILTGLANIFFQDLNRSEGALSFPGDIEKMIEQEQGFQIGCGNLSDFSWKQLLDLEACVACGRCQDVCPAYLSDKILSPKWLIQDSRSHMYALVAKGAFGSSTAAMAALDSVFMEKYLSLDAGLKHLPEKGYYEVTKAFRSSNEKVQGAVKTVGKTARDQIAGEVMPQEVCWACTTCGACMEACPIKVRHIDHIVDNRRNIVLMEGKAPAHIVPTLKALENRGNPFGSKEERTSWIKDLDLRILEAGDSIDYLYWVGCLSAYDPRKQKITQALVKIMNEASLSFGILGTKELCCGDPTRRMGEENLFQSLAKQNIRVLESVNYKTLIASCPHCYNCLKNEYAVFGSALPNVIHHSELIAMLVIDKKVPITATKQSQLSTIHDPCYLSRYNNIDTPLRSIIDALGLESVEMPNSLCCGGGGGHFWMDDSDGKRINEMRLEQIQETQAAQTITACPYCVHMLEDASKSSACEMEVKDIAEIVVEGW